MTLGLACCPRLTADDVKLRVIALAPLLLDEFDTKHFNDRVLRKAAMKFTWFPSFAELAELIREHQSASNSSSMWPRRLRMANRVLAEPDRYGSDVRRIAQWVLDNVPPGTQEAVGLPGDEHDPA